MLTCDYCGEEFPEEQGYGIPRDDEVIFCSSECSCSYEADALERFYDVDPDITSN